MGEFDIEKIMKQMFKHCAGHDIAVMEHVDPLAQELLDRPSEAISKIRQVYETALDQAYGKDRAFVCAIAGGPAEPIPKAVYNAVGAVYPLLDRELRDKALRQVLNILDNINCMYIQISHTPYIHEPLLFGDIVLARPLYWPGFEDHEQLFLKPYKTFQELKERLIDERGLFHPRAVKSSFLMALTLINSNSPFREEYSEMAHKPFLQRVVKGYVAIDFGKVTEKDEFNQRKNNAHSFLPKSLHSSIDSALEEKDWVDYKKFH